MKAVSFNTGWTCKHLDDPAPGLPVSLPHDAMLGEPRAETAAGGTNTGWYEGYDYLYQKTFTPDARYAGKTLILEFEGVYRRAEVWLGDTLLAKRPYGYTNFYVELTGLLRIGQENELRVIARNADQPNSRWYSGAGIYRPVTLWVADAAYIPPTGLRVTTLSIQPAKIEVTVRTAGSGPLTVEIFDGETLLAAATAESDGTATAVLALPGARLWSPSAPQLYSCRATFGTDSAETLFGVRLLHWGRDGFTLNGSRLLLQGACIHHDNGLLGAVCDPDAVERKVRLLRSVGYNALRSAHNPCSKALLEVCDRLGMLVMDEYIDHWYIHKTEYDYVAYFEAWWRQDLTDMVEKDFNHPCVVLYSTGNEVSETAQPRGIALTGEMTEFLHGLDPTRPVTCGINLFFNLLSSVGFGVYSDEKAAREVKRTKAARESAGGGRPAHKKAVGSQFFNNMAGLLGDEFMKRGATLPSCDDKTRDAFANMDIAGYNYGIYRYRHDLKKYPERLILGSETFCKDAFRFRALAQENPRLVGDFVWAGMDYLGEVMVGSWEYGDYAKRFDAGLGWVSAGSGRIDLTGKPLCEAQYTRVALGAADGPFIGVCPVNHTGDRHSPSAWKMSNALESWSWPGYEGRKAQVEVYARAARVNLFVNGKQVGTKKLHGDCMARFSCAYENGVIEAVSFDEQNHELGRAELHTARAETELRAEPEQPTVRPGRLCYIRLRYTDPAGITKPLARSQLTVEVEGGALVGLGNACPYNESGYLSSTTNTYYGEALAIVRAADGGAVRLRATGNTCTGTACVPILQKTEEGI